ncbi:hypothetical protein MKZ38_008697 [Zalerion maritima]|uniref:Uncharacterized protein n=1 Tax=Zalerion maritima TaxID=339359 RepID=A0AAD5WML1_9PEZI|nr:hypothetical protein MKZ38_008697 [Zalerion maritima]
MALPSRGLGVSLLRPHAGGMLPGCVWSAGPVASFSFRFRPNFIQGLLRRESTNNNTPGFALRLQRFLGAISLRTGTEIIGLSMFFNKVTGLYGLMAILTGYALSGLQLTMYIYSVAALAALSWLYPRVRKHEAMPCLGLAWIYAADTLIQTAFTAGFAVDWYLRVGQDKSPFSGTENMASMGIASLLTVLRVYCSLIVAAYARRVLRRGAEGVDEPFAVGTESGGGWKGKAGRYMVGVGRSYWLGIDNDNYDGGDYYDHGDDYDWRRSMGYKYVSGGAGGGDRGRGSREGDIIPYGGDDSTESRMGNSTRQ